MQSPASLLTLEAAIGPELIQLRGPAVLSHISHGRRVSMERSVSVDSGDRHFITQALALLPLFSAPNSPCPDARQSTSQSRPMGLPDIRENESLSIDMLSRGTCGA